MLDKSLPTPLYHQLKCILLKEIRGGVWKPNDRIPTEDQLESRYRVSRATVRQALNELVTEGFVRREQGKGTFVAERKVELGPRELTSFGLEMSRHGMDASSRVLLQDCVAAQGELALRLQARPGERLLRLKRLRLADNQPMGIQSAYLRLDLAPELLRQDFTKGSLYAILETTFGLVPEYAHETHYAVLLDREQCELLGVPYGSPGLAAERLTYLRDGRPMEVVYSVMRGDRYKVTLDLVRVARMGS